LSFDELKTTLQSICAIPVTPFKEDGSVDFETYGLLIERMDAARVAVVTPNGNTSEFYSLAPDEAGRAMQCCVEAAGRMLVMAGVGFDTASAIAAGRSAARAGVAMVMIHQPTHPYQSSDGWVTYHRAISQALPEVGVVPYVRDSSVTGAMIRDLVDTCPNVVGVKYAVANPLQFASVVDFVGPAVTWICGVAELWAPYFWLSGATGFTSGLVNVYSELSIDLLHCLQQGDFRRAMERWKLIKPFEDLRSRRSAANNVPVVKEALAQLGLIGSPMVRPPLSELPESERSEVTAILESWHLLSTAATSRC
jgi:4-hydroxy-tetrahydrodipicolinate synthase